MRPCYTNFRHIGSITDANTELGPDQWVQWGEIAGEDRVPPLIF